MQPPLFQTSKKIILASASPRRINFLKGLGLPFQTIPADIDETAQNNELPETFVRRLAREKALAVAKHHPDAVLIGADTVIDCQGQILGKPADREQALAMLQSLRQMQTHQVITGLALVALNDGIDICQASTTTVHFGDLPDPVLQAYVASGEPMGKAGAYAIQENGGFLVKKISGSSTNVIGLPMYELITLLLDSLIIYPGHSDDFLPA